MLINKSTFGVRKGNTEQSGMKDGQGRKGREKRKRERERGRNRTKEFFIYGITSVTGEAEHTLHVSLRYTWLLAPFLTKG